MIIIDLIKIAWVAITWVILGLPAINAVESTVTNINQISNHEKGGIRKFLWNGTIAVVLLIDLIVVTVFFMW